MSRENEYLSACPSVRSNQVPGFGDDVIEVIGLRESICPAQLPHGNHPSYVGRCDYYRESRPVFEDPFGELESVYATRHTDVGENKVHVHARKKGGESVIGIRCPQNMEVTCLKMCAYVLSDEKFILDNQNRVLIHVTSDRLL
jgi:hypothetical protein